jgi:hypothetical protein
MIMPASGPVHGRTKVRLWGFAFNVLSTTLIAEAVYRCRINGTATVQGQLIRGRNGYVLCEFPEWPTPGPVSVHVSTNGGVDYGPRGIQFTFYVHLRVRRVVPTHGSELGSTAVTVYGTGFIRSRRTYCQFGATKSLQATHVSENILVCLSPPHNPVTVAVEVTVNGVAYSSDSVQFVYSTAATITALNPSSGFMSGGTILVVHGNNFHLLGTERNDSLSQTRGFDLFCQFGHVLVPAARLSPAMLRCVTPPVSTTLHAHSLLTLPENAKMSFRVNVVNRNGKRQVVNNGLLFLMRAPLEVVALSPKWGPSTGGTPVRVMGRRFENSN